MKRPEPEGDTRSTEELFAYALTHPEGSTASRDPWGGPHWRAIYALQIRGSREIFEGASRLCDSVDPKERQVGVDILAQLGWTGRPFKREVVGVLLRMLKSETDENVLYSIAIAFNHTKSRRAIRPLSALADHSDDGIRFGVAYGLLGHEDDLAVRTLIKLSKDRESEVRDWSTFGLGTQIEMDTSEIREALYQRIRDRHYGTRCEAIRGLANRKDERVIEPLLKELARNKVGKLIIEAAAAIADPRLYPALLKLNDETPNDDDIEAALAACRAET